MAGTINLALSQQFDSQGVPLSGGLLHFFEAASTTPQSAFQDTALTIELPNPIVLDASGRIPMFYLANTTLEGNPSGQIKIRLTDDSGVVIIAADNLLIIGPAGEGGSGGGADPTTVLETGDIKARFGTGTLAGFVRCNGGTIGPAGSSATEALGTEVEALFKYLWNLNLTGISVEPSRGASAVADWDDGLHRVTLPDLRGRTIAGMEDMGGPTIQPRLSSAYFGVSSLTLGNAGGTENHTLLAAQLAAHSHGITQSSHTHSVTEPSGTLGHIHGTTEPNSGQGHQHNIKYRYGAGNFGTGGAFSYVDLIGTGLAETGTSEFAATGLSINLQPSGVSIAANSASISIDNFPTVSATPHPNIQPTLVLTFYIKL